MSTQLDWCPHFLTGQSNYLPVPFVSGRLFFSVFLAHACLALGNSQCFAYFTSMKNPFAILVHSHHLENMENVVKML